MNDTQVVELAEIDGMDAVEFAESELFASYVNEYTVLMSSDLPKFGF